MAWIQPDISGCQQDFLVVWRKSVENILGYIREQFYRFSRGCRPRENLWNCSRKYTKMFKTDSFLGNKKLSLNQNVWRDHATMQQDVLLHFWVVILSFDPLPVWIYFRFGPTPCLGSTSSLGPNQKWTPKKWTPNQKWTPNRKWTKPEVDPNRKWVQPGSGP